MNVCRNCGNVIENGDKYCRKCGMKRNAEKFVPKKNGEDVLCIYAPPVTACFECENCGHKWEENVLGDSDTEYCPKCGAAVSVKEYMDF